MVGRLIVGLIWLTFVRSDPMENMRMGEGAEKMSMGMMSNMEGNTPPLTEIMGMKSKRFLSHQHGSACPPFYPNLASHMKMYAMRPYGPPAYPKNDIHHVMHQPPKELQFVHQPSYSSYVPKQTIQYVKPEYKAPIYQSPIYHVPVMSPPIVHAKPVPAIVKPEQPNYYHHYQQPIFQPKMYPKPVFSYAPAYHKPAPMIWPATPVKKWDYSPPQVAYHQPAIVYKPDPPKCAPCPAPHPPPQHPQPSLAYLKVIQPAVHHMEPANTYLPAPVHPTIVKPC